MNTLVNKLLNTFSNEEAVKLTTIAAETFPHKPFTAAELWDIQRRRRSFVQRRFNA